VKIRSISLNRLLSGAVPALLVASPLALADQAITPEELASRLPGVELSDISEAPLPGFYQIVLGAEIAYVSMDGRYIMQGELYDLAEGRNLSEKSRAASRIDVLSSIDPATMIVFSPQDAPAKHTVTIFTDIDCGYCRQFHREIDKVTAMGIEVRYVFYPRSGPDTDSWEKADTVWCSPDRNTALTQAKLGVRLPDATCESTPVADHFSYGIRVGLRGTPSMYSAGGELLGGYLAPAALAERLDELARAE
jgi:thiol:disulfide interchange protein DsbC